MDMEKSLYMADFLKMREDLGKVKLYPVMNTLFINLYDDFKSKQQSEEVVEVIEEIQDKTIQIGKEKGQHTFFDDEAAPESAAGESAAPESAPESAAGESAAPESAPESAAGESAAEGEGEGEEEIKIIKVSDETSKGGDPAMKTITFDPTYVAS